MSIGVPVLWGVGVVLWDNGVVRDDAVLKNLRKA